VPRLDRVMVVIEENGERLQRMGLPAERITLVSNTPPASAAARAMPRTRAEGAPLGLTYLGLVELSRGLDVAVEAVRILRDAGREVRLDVIGGGGDLEYCRAYARKLGLGENAVTFHGFVPGHEQALALVARADVGLLTHRTHEMWNTTIPNKLFDYMAAGMPVVTSDPVPFARIVRETGAGEVFASGDPADLARAVTRFFDPAERERCGRAGRQAVRDKYNWERDSARLLECVESVGRRGERPRVPEAVLA